ncbi:MAG: hypothetical protein ABL868_08995, partial [Sulfuriferula sp.]
VRRVAAKMVVDCAPTSPTARRYDAAINALAAELPRFMVRKTVAKAILSNHFMRYTLMPWSETLSDAAEELAYARHCFRQLYGAAAERWELRLSPERVGLPQLVSAVDLRFLTALREVFARNSITLASTQPLLMAAYNNCRPSLQHRSAGFVLYEPGCLSLALLQDGHWHSVRTLRAGSDWRDTLMQVLAREAYLVDADATMPTIYLWAPELGEDALPASGQWQIHNLQPQVRSAFMPEYEGRYAMALSG